MKVHIVSAIHGNWPALQAVLAAEPDGALHRFAGHSSVQQQGIGNFDGLTKIINCNHDLLLFGSDGVLMSGKKQNSAKRQNMSIHQQPDSRPKRHTHRKLHPPTQQ
jgi:hypothetical protein